MVNDLWCTLFSRKTVDASKTRQDLLDGFEAIYARSWIDGWVQRWYFDHSTARFDETEEFDDSKHISKFERVQRGLDRDPVVVAEDIELISKALRLLTDRQREVLCHYLGLEGYDVISDSELAYRFNVTPQYISLIVKNALARLRRPDAVRVLNGLSAHDIGEDSEILPEVEARRRANMKESQEKTAEVEKASVSAEAELRAAALVSEHAEVERDRWCINAFKADAEWQRENEVDEPCVIKKSSLQIVQEIACVQAVVAGKSTPERVKEKYGIDLAFDVERGWHVHATC